MQTSSTRRRRKREKYLENIKKAHKKKKKNLAPRYNFSALHLVHDPQDFGEKLFRQLESLNEKSSTTLSPRGTPPRSWLLVSTL